MPKNEYIGESQIIAKRIGSDPVLRVYVGATLVWDRDVDAVEEGDFLLINAAGDKLLINASGDAVLINAESAAPIYEVGLYEEGLYQ